MYCAKELKVNGIYKEAEGSSVFYWAGIFPWEIKASWAKNLVWQLKREELSK